MTVETGSTVLQFKDAADLRGRDQDGSHQVRSSFTEIAQLPSRWGRGRSG